MKQELTWIWGRHPVLEGLKAGTVRTVVLAEGRDASTILRDIVRSATAAGIPVREVPPSELREIAPGQNTQGVAARVAERRLAGIPELLQPAAESKVRPFLLVLDQVQDPQNMGTLFRTAEAAGVHGVIVPEKRSSSLSGVMSKTSAGAVSRVPILEVMNLSRCLDEVRENGIWVAGLDGSAQQSLYATDLREPIALVVGSEGKGLRRLTREHCDFLLNLPMFGSIGSLNAAVAGSIAMYEVVRQRMRNG